ncbi:MAG: hypothetical protein HC822_03235 [Oscillochloris sp.]|nr:hypothetical protein [Oscillochloris sp.]
MNHLPPWLRNLPLPPKPAAADAPVAPPAGAAAPASSDTPDWLRDLEQEVEQPSSDAAAAASGDTDTPDWLRDLAQEAEQMPPSDSDSALRSASFGATDWLRSIGAEGSDTPEQPETPEPPAEPPPTTTSRIRMPVGATDWLRSIGQETDLDEELAASDQEFSGGDEPEPEVPDWLHDVTPEELISTSEAEQMASREPDDPNVPDWLRDSPIDRADQSTVAADLEPAPLEETIAASDDVPDWLREIVPPEDLSAVESRRDRSEPPSWLQDATSADDDFSAGSDMPDWLQQVSSEEAPSEPAGGAPSWLRDADEPAAGEPEVSDQSSEDDGVPAWLREVEATQTSRTPATPERSTPTEAEEAPAWLQDFAQQPSSSPADAARGDDMPDWLHDGEDAPGGPPAGETRGDQSPGALPQWLDEDAESATASPARPGTNELSLPSWLRGVSDEAPPPARRRSGHGQAMNRHGAVLRRKIMKATTFSAAQICRRGCDQASRIAHLKASARRKPSTGSVGLEPPTRMRPMK